jgi:hypothetical protein
MKHLQLFLLLFSACLFACKKQIITETTTGTTKEEATNLPSESMYFDLRSNPGVKMPAKFASTKEAIGFLTKNYKRVNKDGSPYGTTKGMVAPTARTEETTPSGETLPSETSSYNSGSTAGYINGFEFSTVREYDFMNIRSSYNLNELCLTWLNTTPFITPFGWAIEGSKAIYGISLSAYYAERGITCTLKFDVKYAPGSFTKLVYANRSYPTLQISGATGSMEPANAFLTITSSTGGTAVLYGSQNENRVYIITTSGLKMFKPGFAENYPPGTIMPDGSEVKYSYTTTTRYNVLFNVQFLDYDVLHYDGEYCDWNTGVPSLVYMDAGTNFTGVPQ